MDAKKIGQKLKDLRTERNETQEQVASNVGISRATVENYERGIRVPRDKIKRDLADYFDKSVEEIFFAN